MENNICQVQKRNERMPLFCHKDNVALETTEVGDEERLSTFMHQGYCAVNSWFVLVV